MIKCFKVADVNDDLDIVIDSIAYFDENNIEIRDEICISDECDTVIVRSYDFWHWYYKNEKLYVGATYEHDLSKVAFALYEREIDTRYMKILLDRGAYVRRIKT
jgi:hypothetical protein